MGISHESFPSLAYEIDPVLAAAERAPVVELTDEERALLAEVEDRPARWISQGQFASALHSHDDAR